MVKKSTYTYERVFLDSYGQYSNLESGGGGGGSWEKYEGVGERGGREGEQGLGGGIPRGFEARKNEGFKERIG